MPAGGLGVLREQTQRFINENPSDIIFSRATKADDGAGGQTTTRADLSAQTLRLVAQNPTTASEVRTVDGEVLKTMYSIIANHDADITEGDRFTFLGVKYEVVTFANVQGYEVRAEVVRRG